MVQTFLTSGLASCLLLALAANEAEAAAAAPPNQPAPPTDHSLLRGDFHSGGTSSGADRNFLYVEGAVARQEYGGGYKYGGGAVRHDNDVGSSSNVVRQDYGCISAAGYSWCASLSTCLRPFETPCPSVQEILQPLPAGPIVDHYGCRAAAGETYCAYTRRCERPGGCYVGGPVIMPGSDVDNYGCRASEGHSYCHSSKTCELYGECLNPIILGEDRDQYGCLGSAGYSWCATFKECIRTFDTTCPPPTAGPSGGDIDQWGCRPSAGFSYCPSSKTCARYYECREHQPVDDVDEFGCCPAAGYTWCPSRYQCLRAWETECFVPRLPVEGIDQYGCQLSSGFSYCAYTRHCERPGECQEGLLCPAVYEPVSCGAAGDDFSNLCEAERDGYYPHHCTRLGSHTGGHNPTSCGFVYEPVICDGYQYSNFCLAGIAGYADYQCLLEGGEVTHSCPTVHDPVCCEGQQFSNQCFADSAGYGPSTSNLCSIGECRVVVVVPVQPVRPVNPVRPIVEPVFVGCDQIYDPVCCEGYDFANFCEAEQVNPGDNGRSCTSGECRPVPVHNNNPVVVEPVRPVNPVGPVNCGTVFEPVCCDGNTFSNFCEAEQVYGFSPKSCAIGECRPVKNIPVGPVGCDTVYDPVCCDGNQFPNLCEAERVGRGQYSVHSCIIGECRVY